MVEKRLVGKVSGYQKSVSQTSDGQKSSDQKPCYQNRDSQNFDYQKSVGQNCIGQVPVGQKYKVMLSVMVMHLHSWIMGMFMYGC